MKKRYILAIDGGSQSTKVSIFDTQGTVHAQAVAPLRALTHYADGRVEHPDDDLWDSLIAACASAMHQFAGEPQQIAAIGLCTIRCCRAVLRADGSLASPVMSWMDVRLGRPYENTDQAVHYVTTSSGYIGHRLTGLRVDTAANYEGQWPIDKATWDWSAEEDVVARFNIPREKLFSLVMPGETIGGLTEHAAQALGLAVGTPVIATANDKAVEALGVGLNTHDRTDTSTLISLGTYIGGMRSGATLRNEPEHFFCNMAAQPFGYLYESGGIRFGMSMISWLRDLLNDGRLDALSLINDQTLNAEAALLPIGSDGLITIPHFLAANDQPHQRGCFIGVQAKHGRAHLFRAILESIAMTMYNHVNAMQDELQQPSSGLFISGGGAKSDLLMQIFADLFNTPTTRPSMTDAAGLGAAICAAVAVGLHDSFASAQQNMVNHERTFTPNPQRGEKYRALNEVFRTASKYTDTLLCDLYQVNQKLQS